ncbi:hypothetical protein C5S53_14115 [Methanophagales archaeon]|nr:hypothetical protein C5S53_14115 [Methanophagales archaeon]
MKKTITLVVLAAFLMSVFSVTAIAAIDSAVPVPEEMSGGSIEVLCNESVVNASAENAEDEDYTNLQISPRDEWFRIKPGGEKELTIRVKNKENESVFTSPRLEPMLYGEYFLEEEWITFEPSSAEIESEEVQEYTVTMKIPEDAEIGDYITQIVFTNDTISTPCLLPFLPQPNAIILSIDVWEPQKIMIQPRYIHGMLEAGQTKEYKIHIENKGDEAISISPEIEEEEYMSMPYENPIPDEWLTIDAPAAVDANSTATVNVTVDVPADAKGGYEGCIKLNIDDSAADRFGRDYEVHISFGVWKQPKTAYQQNFTVKQGQNFSVVISASQRRYDKYATGAEEMVEPSFNVSLALAGLEGEDMTPEPSKTVKTVDVSLGSDYLPPEDVTSDETYHVSHIEYSETYKVTNATGGVWTLEILPKNTQSFEYTIEIGG